jgi:hypothetical protein
MNISLLAKSAVGAAALAVASLSAQAAVFDLGALTPGVMKNFNGGVVGNSVVFGDIYSFSLGSAAGETQYGVIDLPFPFFGLGTSLSYAALYANPDGVTTGFNGDEGLPMEKVFGDANNEINFTRSPTSAGSYFLVVSGVTTGTNGGAYSGSILATAPIPEPESYAMLLAGLGVMGAIAMRRNKRKTH